MVKCQEHLLCDTLGRIEKTAIGMVTEKSRPNEEPGKYQQIIAAVIINIAAFGYGLMIGWPSPMTPQLQSDDSPVGTEPMSNEAASWLGGALCIGGLIGTPLVAAVAEKFGRKVAGCLIVLPHGVCWLLTIFAEDQNYLFVARFFAGIAGAGAILVIPLYIGEIASDKIRGMLGSLLVFFVNAGILAAYILGSLVSFHVFAICAAVLPIVHLAAFVFMPETPTYLVRCNRMAEAGRSLDWFRGGDTEVVEKELIHLSAIAKESQSSQQKVGFMDLFKSRGTIRGVLITFGLLGGQQLSGIFAITSYSAPIFEAAGSSMSPDISAVVIGVIQVAGSYVSTLLMERAGRRLLVLISTSGMWLCLCSLGVFSYLQTHSYDVSSFSWLPVVALSAFVIVYSLGMGPVPFVIASEVFSPEISGLANSVSILFLWTVAFIVLKFFATLSALIGIHGCFFLFAACCASTFFFALVLLPETKGRTLDSILDELNGKSKSSGEEGYTMTIQTVTVINDDRSTAPPEV